MSLESVAQKFVELCNQGKNFEVMETMYAPGIVSIEASGEQVSGKEPVIEKSRKWGAVNTVHGEKVRGPYYATATGAAGRSSGQFAVHFTFEITPKSTGQRIAMEEIGLYTVENDLITREQFFFEGVR